MGWQDDEVVPSAQSWQQDEVVALSRDERIADLKRSNPAEYDPDSPEFRAKYGATAGMSDAQLFAAGAGKAVTDLGRGVRQVGAEVADFVDPREQTVAGLIADRDPSRGGALRREQDDVNERDAALMNTGWGVAGNIGGNVATVLVPGAAVARGAQAAGLARTANAARAFTAPRTYGAAVGSGAAVGAAQPVGTGESRIANTAVGAGFGAAGTAVLNTVGRIAQPVKQALSKEAAKAVRVLTAAGVPLDLTQRTGSRAAGVVKRAIDDNPLTAPGQAAFRDNQQRAFTRAVLRTIGEDADAATDDVMAAAQSRIGQVFDNVAARNPVRYDSQLHNELGRISRDSFRELPSNEAAVIGRQVEEIFAKAQAGGGLIDGAAYQNLRTSLGRISAQRSPLGHWAGDLRETIDDALARSLNPADKDALKLARSQYRRMLQLEGAIDREGAGQISAAKLANSLGTKSNRRSSIYGRGDTALVRLAQAGKQLLPDRFPNSGTAARLLGQVAVGTAAGAGLGATQGDVSQGALAGLAAGGLGLGAARRVINSQRVSNALATGMRPGFTRNAIERSTRSPVLRAGAVPTGFGWQRREEERR